MQKQNNGFTPLFLVFLILTQQIAWQGYGDVNRTVVDTIMAYINTNISAHTADSSYDAFNTAFSNELNRRWDPAWNVFTIVTTSAYDCLVYGYAFRNHWMWYNDYQVNGVVLSFVIWKDYNCQGWKTVGKNGAASGSPYKSSFGYGYQNQRYEMNDMWRAAKSMSNYVTGGDGQYSTVVCQDQGSDIYGRICVVRDNYFYTKSDNAGSPTFKSPSLNTVWGNALIFQA